MKSTFLLLAFAMVSLSVSASTEPKPVKVDSENSKIAWKGYKVLGEHEGTINVQEGVLEFEGDMLVGGTITIDMSSIAVTDLEPGKGKEKLEGHLNSDDFFGISTYPTATLDITKVISRGKTGDYKVLGNLTIKGKTNPVKFNAMVNDGTATATVKIDRTEYDVRYGSGSFFDSLGDNTIYDEFDLNVSLAY